METSERNGSHRRFEDRIPILTVLEGLRPTDRSILQPLLSNTSENPPEEVAAILHLEREERAVIVGRLQALSGERPHESVEEAFATWNRERMHLLDRARTAEEYVVFAEQTARSRTAQEVLQSLIDHAAAVAGGYRAMIWGDGEGEGLLPDLRAPILVTGEDTRSQGGFAALAPIFDATGSLAASVAPIEPNIALLVLERRGHRSYEPRHWFLLRAMARLTRAGLERLRVIDPADPA